MNDKLQTVLNEQTELHNVHYAINTIEELSAVPYTKVLLWKWNITDNYNETGYPVLSYAVVNHVLLTSKIWENAGPREKGVLTEYVSFINSIKQTPLHIYEEASGILLMKYVYEGVFFLFRYTVIPLEEILKNEKSLSFEAAEYTGAFYVPGVNIPFLVAFISSIYPHLIDEGYTLSITKVFPLRSPEEAALLTGLHELSQKGKGAPINIKLIFPSRITKFTLKRMMHLIESRNVWVNK